MIPAVTAFLRGPALFPVLSMILSVGACWRWWVAGNVGQAAWWGLGVVSTFILTFIIGRP